MSKIIIITGASDGIGAAAAEQLVHKGHKVAIVGRSASKTKAVAEALGVESYVADFTDLGQVRTLAATLNERYPTIDVLVNNAGGIFGNREVTSDGHEKTFQVNHLAPFLLTNLLLPTLIRSKASVLNTSSIANKLLSKFDIDDLDATRGYSANRAYGNAKLANILFTRELHRRHHADGISTAAFHPGNVASNFASDSNSVMRYLYHSPLKRLLFISTTQGADNTVWLANGEPGTDWVSGEYYIKHKISPVHALASDPELARRLWHISEQMTGL